MYSAGIDDGQQYGGGFFWNGGGHQVFDGETGASSAQWSNWTPSTRFGWQVICGANQCNYLGTDDYLSVEEAKLAVHETVQPTVAGTGGLWQSSGWIRGDWTLGLSGSSPTGICAMSATLSRQPVPGASFVSAHNSSVWQQCGGSLAPVTVHTADPVYGQGPSSLAVSGYDAAGQGASAARTVELDNAPPAVSLAGPTDAPSTAGTQTVVATATAGPSGVSGIGCSLDGAPSQSYASAVARVPIQGVGVHHLTCAAANNARDAAGNPAISAPATWTLSIRQPSVSAVSFSRTVAALRCTRMRERVRIPAQWVTVRVRGTLVRVKVPAQTRTRTVVRCHPRFGLVRVRTPHGWRTRRVALLPRTVQTSSKRVPFGATTSVSGWLGTSSGDALGAQQVRIMTAPDNAQGQFTQAASATTAPDGTWSVRLAAGPSRIVEAVYAGSATVEPSISSPAHLIVPASVALGVTPRRTHWGGTIVFSGVLRGGFIPPAGELVVLHVGWSGGSAEVGHVYAAPDGRFVARYTFLRGNGFETYRFWATTATETDYPYASNRSGKIVVSVSP